jgi:hypothetical protein
MSDADKYRLFAQECMRLADETKNLRRKAMVLEMAQEWFRLAIEEDRKGEGEAEGGNGKGLIS